MKIGSKPYFNYSRCWEERLKPEIRMIAWRAFSEMAICSALAFFVKPHDYQLSINMHVIVTSAALVGTVAIARLTVHTARAVSEYADKRSGSDDSSTIGSASYAHNE